MRRVRGLYNLAVSAIGKILLGATKLDEFNGKAYSIGPAGFRVGFCFQQRRALNVAGALKESKRFPSDTRIAVVGGGLAGTSCYLALRGLGFSTCRLYEAAPALIDKQSFAGHRILHPCYNDWPITTNFSSTTSFPFLNWFTHSADNVTRTLVDEWEGQHASRLPVPRTLHRVESAENSGKNEVLLKISARDENGSWKSLKDSAFDLVIFASGFGIEATSASSAEGSYWASDKIDIYREAETEKKLYVSGIGDGGLIDFIRLCFHERHVHSLPIFTISELRHPEARKIRKPGEYSPPPRSSWEERIFKAEQEAALLLPENPIQRAETFGEDVENEIAELLSARYAEIVDDLPDGLLQMLDKSRVRERPVRLIGNLQKPFSLDTAPINKILIAHILSENPELYVRGWMEQAGDNFLVRTPCGNNFTIPNQQAIVRHGARPPVYDISPEFEKKNKYIPVTVADFTEAQFKPENFCEHISDHASVDVDEPEFRNNRTKLAIKFAKEHFGAEIGSGYSRDNNFFHFFFNRNAIDVDSVIKRTGEFPHQLFGVPLLTADAAPIDDGLNR